MTVKFRLRKEQLAVDLFKPAGHYDSFKVEPGGPVDVPGELVTSRPEPKDGEEPLPPLPDDAYVVANGGEEKSWPHSLWELVTDKPAAKAPAVKEES
jgi:hypothetical protein